MASAVLRSRDLLTHLFQFQHGVVPDMRPLNQVVKSQQSSLDAFLHVQDRSVFCYEPKDLTFLLKFQAVFFPWLLKYAFSRLQRLVNECRPAMRSFVLLQAAYTGIFELFKLVLELELEQDVLTTLPLAEIAARRGHLQVLRYLHQIGVKFAPTVMDVAARSGRLEVVKYLHEQVKAPCTYYAMDAAASFGHLDVMKYLHSHRTEGCSPDVLFSAVSSGHTQVVEFLCSHYPETLNAAGLLNYACYFGHLNVVKFLHERGDSCNVYGMDRACERGHLEVVQFLHDNRTEGCSTEAMTLAASNGHVEIVKFLHLHKYTSNMKEALGEAERHDRSRVIEYLCSVLQLPCRMGTKSSKNDLTVSTTTLPSTLALEVTSKTSS